MEWHEIAVHIKQMAAEAVSQYFHDQGAGGVSIEESWHAHKQRETPLGEWYDIPFNDIPEGEVVVKAYFAAEVGHEAMHKPGALSLHQRLQNLNTFLAQLEEWGIDAGEPEVRSKQVHENDWAEAWKRYFKPTRVTPTLTVKPTWEPYQAADEEKVIELDPGMAFGTGTHATTVLSLQLLEKYVDVQAEVIDVGTGSGILSIACALLGASRVLAVDLDPVAVSSARANAELNGLSERITVAESDLLGVLRQEDALASSGLEAQHPLPVKLPVQVVVANILAEILLRFVDDVAKALEPGGIYIASGIIRAKAAEVETALIRHGFAIIERREQEDWIALAARKR